MTAYHEPVDELKDKDRDIHRALNSLIEEIEAVDWYHQRVVTTSDPELKEILAHNRDEEIEHAAMALEWLRRNMDKWDEELKTYLFTSKNILEVEEEEEH
jgi:hypothetical protein